MLEELRKLGDLYKQPIVFCTSKDIQPHVGIPVKVNIESGGKMNGIPERR